MSTKARKREVRKLKAAARRIGCKWWTLDAEKPDTRTKTRADPMTQAAVMLALMGGLKSSR